MSLTCATWRPTKSSTAADNNGAYFGGNRHHCSAAAGFHAIDERDRRRDQPSGPAPSWQGTATHSQSAKVCDMTNGVITCV